MITQDMKDEFVSSLDELSILWLTLYGEFRGEPVEAVIAGGNVIMNRIGEGGKNIKDVCLKSRAFSCWNLNDVNLTAIFDVHSRIVPNEFSVVRQIKYIAAGLMTSQFKDNSNGSNHYLGTALYRSNNCPAWAKDNNARYRAVVGRTTFIWCP